MIYERVCAVLPLEFRGGDLVSFLLMAPLLLYFIIFFFITQTFRRQVEHVMDCLLDAENGLKSAFSLACAYWSVRIFLMFPLENSYGYGQSGH